MAIQVYENISANLVETGEAHLVGVVYSCILKNGLVTANDIAILLSLNIDVITDCLERLLILPLISADMTPERALAYHALPPRDAFGALILAANWGVPPSLSENPQSTIALQLWEEAVRKRKEAYQALIDLAEPVYKEVKHFKHSQVQVGQSRDRMTALLADRFIDASNEITAVVSPPHLLGPLIWTILVRKMKEGVVYRRITTADEILRHGLKITKREVDEFGVQLSYVPRQLITQKYYVVDGSVAAFFSPRAGNREFSFSGQIITNKGIAERFRKEFDCLEGKSIKAAATFSAIDEQKNSLISKAKDSLCDWEIKWLERLVDYGAFVKPQISQYRVEHVTSKCANLGLINKEIFGYAAALDLSLFI